MPPAQPTTAQDLRELENVMPGGPASPATTPPAQPPLLPETPVVQPPAVQPAAPLNAEDQARRELEEFLDRPQPQPESAPVKPTLLHMTDVEGKAGEASAAARNYGDNAGFVWVYRDDQWVRVPAGQAQPATVPAVTQRTAPTVAAPKASPTARPESPMPPATPQEAGQPWSPPVLPADGAPDDANDPFNWATADMSNLSRVIVIDLQALKGRDPRMNIIIRDNDVVLIPGLEIGEFYVMGEVSRPGVYNLTGRKVTVKMALAAAGDLGPLSWPSNSILIRRVGANQELRIPLNIDLIMNGKEPDIFLKPNDVVAVGSHIAAPFLAVMRNAFRLTYGFGFIYDRNFAEANLNGQFNEIDSFFR
jgi:hypothetical protein